MFIWCIIFKTENHFKKSSATAQGVSAGFPDKDSYDHWNIVFLLSLLKHCQQLPITYRIQLRLSWQPFSEFISQAATVYPRKIRLWLSPQNAISFPLYLCFCWKFIWNLWILLAWLRVHLTVEPFLTIHFETLTSSKTAFIIGNQTRISKGLALSSWLKLTKRHVLSGKPMDAINQDT